MNDIHSLQSDIFNGEKDIAIFVVEDVHDHDYVSDSNDDYCINLIHEYKTHIKMLVPRVAL